MPQLRVFLTLIFFSYSTFAFRLSPLSSQIVLGKNKNTTVYQITNNSEKPMAIQVEIIKRIMDIDGGEKTPEVAQGLFSVFPNQLILKKGEKRGIKVTYLGDKNFDLEKSYRFKIEQLPIDFDKSKKTGIKILMKYMAALYVKKEHFKSKVILLGVKEEKDHYIIELENQGNSRQLLRKLRLDIGNGKRFVESDQLKNFSGENILAGNKRRFSVARSVIGDLKGQKIKLIYE